MVPKQLYKIKYVEMKDHRKASGFGDGMKNMLHNSSSKYLIDDQRPSTPKPPSTPYKSNTKHNFHQKGVNSPLASINHQQYNYLNLPRPSKNLRNSQSNTRAS